MRTYSDSFSASRLVLLAPLVIPWTITLSRGEIGLVFAWGIVGVDPFYAVPVSEYVFQHARAGPIGLPRHLIAWPTATLLYVCALGSAAVAAVGREDTRLTAGLLVIAGVSLLTFAAGLSASPVRTALPVGTVILGAVAWLVYDGADGFLPT